MGRRSIRSGAQEGIGLLEDCSAVGSDELAVPEHNAAEADERTLSTEWRMARLSLLIETRDAEVVVTAGYLEYETGSEVEIAVFAVRGNKQAAAAIVPTEIGEIKMMTVTAICG